jgi:copper chaperone CopZ
MTTTCGDDKKPLLAAGGGCCASNSCASTSYGSTNTTTTTTTTTCSNKKKLSPKAQREKDSNNKRVNGGLFGFLAMFTDTDNARTNVRECCTTGTCSECIKEQQRLLSLSSKLKPSDDSTNSFNSHGSHGSHSNGGDIHSCGNPLSLPCKKKDRDLCPTHRKVALDPNVGKDGLTTVRSTIVCKGICCSSEVPELLEILEPLQGVAEVKINVPLKQVIIDHDSQIISASQIVVILNDELFPSTVQRDGGASLPSIVRSTFTCKGICCSSEVPTILEILNPFEGVVEVKVNVPVRKVIVDHDCKFISALQIAKILTDESFETNIESDGGSSTNVAGVEGRSKFHVSQICCASEIPQIRSALEPLHGVKGLMVNVATKMVYVDHSTNVISADKINDALNEVDLGSTVKYDCYKDAGGFLSSFVMSKFAILPSSSESSAADSKSYLKTFDKDQVEGYQLDKKAKTITIIHNPLLISADDLKKSLLEKTGLKTDIEEDGNEGKIWEFPQITDEEQKSTDENASSSTSIRPSVVICGVFWIISMLSNIGGTW